MRPKKKTSTSAHFFDHDFEQMSLQNSSEVQAVKRFPRQLEIMGSSPGHCNIDFDSS